MVDLEAMPGERWISAEPHPTYLVDAQALVGVPLDAYDLVLADPPYSAEDAEHYGTPMVNRDRVMRALEELSPGTHVVWLDQVLPRYRKLTFAREFVIGVSRSIGHRFRVVNIFRRADGEAAGHGR